MHQRLTTFIVAGLTLVALPFAAHVVKTRGSGADAVCDEISKAISSASSVHWPGSSWLSGSDQQYAKDIEHWATSSAQDAACSVEPGTAEDVGTILRILWKNKTPFAVKGGGHTYNPGFSSTKGVQIAMYRFSEVKYDSDANVAEVGAGLIWDEVYEALEPYAVNVVGGRVTGVGVAGFTLGGGYSWKTNRLGLTVDNLTGFELVLPNGTIAAVNQDSHPDLFWGLKGGFNNFGIITKFNLTTHAQTEVWGGMITFTKDQLEKVNAATVKFSQQTTDPRAAVLPTYNFVLGGPGVSLLLFYDYPTAPEGLFDDYLAIPHFTKDVKTRSFLDLVKVAPANATGGQRYITGVRAVPARILTSITSGICHTVSLLQYTDKIMDAVLNETKFWGERLSWKTGHFISYDVEPFLPSIFSHAAEGSSAFPPSRAQGLLPFNIYYAWGASFEDETFQDAARQSAAHLSQIIQAEGQDVADAALYGNYAIFDTPLERIYGANLPRLKELKAQYDPEGVMNLAGGWKF
ncbi:FAD-binding domain-containing protein [Trametes elegans]|nr:FAD-binding domain-containing protein [Trametes elegans]